MTMYSRRFFLVLLPLLCGLGCADKNAATVSGTILVDGQPAKKGYISFDPVDGMTPTAGAKIVDGKYTAQMVPGNKKVAIRVPIVVGQARAYAAPDAPLQAVEDESLPAKYNDQTELTLEVKAGENTQNYDIESKAGGAAA